MRVLHIVHGKVNPEGHNGISRVVYHLHKNQRALGIDSEIWGLVDGIHTHLSYVRDADVTVECFPRVRLPFGKNEIITRLRAEKDKIDLVHFHMIYFFDKNIVAKALNDIGLPFVLTSHGTYTTLQAYTGKRGVVRHLYEKRFLSRAKEVHCLTREEGTGLRRYGYNGASFEVPNGLALDDLPFEADPYDAPAYQSVAKDTGPVRAVWVGVLRDDKNVRALIEAVSLLPVPMAQRLNITMVGPDYKDNLKKYHAYCRELGVAENFDFTGPLYGSEKYDAIRAADFYVMPSHSEGMSLALLEAFASARPALLTSGCGMNYYRDRDFFVTCEPYGQDIATGLQEMMERQADWAKMGARALQAVRDIFNWRSVAEKMGEEYKRILEEQVKS